MRLLAIVTTVVASLLLGGFLRLLTVAFTVVASLVFMTPAFGDYVALDDSQVTQGQMRVKSSTKVSTPAATQDEVPAADNVVNPVSLFVLKETRVDAKVSGVFARVVVEQVFQNPYSQRLEAEYVFPLPEDAAVDGYTFLIGETEIQGVVKERERARREYEEAREDGRKGALLEQERQNIFTQSVANIDPGEEVRVRIQYVHPIKVDEKNYTFRFPMVVAPRYMPGSSTGGPNLGRGWANDTTTVPDASRISPPILPQGQRVGNDVFINLEIDAGMPISQVTPVTHPLHVEQPTETNASIRLQNAATIANKDFVVEYSLSEDHTVLASLTHKIDASAPGYVTLVLQPKRQLLNSEFTAREMVLVLDHSGSMQGPAISQLRIMAQQVLDALNPQDTFRIIAFSTHVTELSAQALEATPANVEQGKAFCRQLQAGGGTNLLDALKRVVSSNIEQQPVRQLVLLSDALVGNDDQILGYIRTGPLQGTRIFPIAIGASPNHYLIQRAAELGRGFSLYVTNQDNAQEMAKRLNDKCASPFLTDLQIDWGGLNVSDVLPERLPDLSAGEPLVVMARYEKPGTAEIKLSGNLRGQAISMVMPLTLPEQESQHDSLAPMWAQKKIRGIWNRNVGKETRQSKSEITQLGLEHQLVTRYTSFVAIEKEATQAVTGQSLTHSVPTLLPEGMTQAAASPNAFRKRQAVPTNPSSRPQPRQKPTYAHRQQGRKQQRSDDRGWHGGGGGSVEWVFLAATGLVAAAETRRRRRQVGPNPAQSEA